MLETKYAPIAAVEYLNAAGVAAARRSAQKQWAAFDINEKTSLPRVETPKEKETKPLGRIEKTVAHISETKDIFAEISMKKKPRN